ncbi:hypothetical protein CQW49_07515 [Methylosinus trichosporium OB3b]|uniref:Uncharacterized protein n=1 Tax=Methylosinus trichosporium (strain ATCC 35070 / NCIMB 11131 / UNIQEM 75 / OB3b) TaxID=595536 RepID=A0A2D2CYE8_METT3|nr:hypothetical protein CQW49_07515 [Methylosinus trichosporium OB3b]OBS51136.1 hypothetical protein A8B73_17590 [Methylosinus sp. 3S-1]
MAVDRLLHPISRAVSVELSVWRGGESETIVLALPRENALGLAEALANVAGGHVPHSAVKRGSGE